MTKIIVKDLCVGEGVGVGVWVCGGVGVCVGVCVCVFQPINRVIHACCFAKGETEKKDCRN